MCHPDADPGGTQEQQAHAFAAELLMPRHHIHRLLPRRFDLRAYARLKQEWGVSIAALLYRARTLEVITDAAHRRAVMTMNKTYGRRNEPFPLHVAEHPTLLNTALDVAAANGVTCEQVANLVGLPVQDVRLVVGEPGIRPMVTPN